jgi:hypothetical protein
MADLKDLSLTQLKAVAYEQMIARDTAVNNLNIIQPLINDKIREEQDALIAANAKKDDSKKSKSEQV